MAATARSTGSANWSANATWAITDIGTASGADGALASGVLTPTISPTWTVGALIGRYIQLDGGTWYLVTDNDAISATLDAPPADDPAMTYLLGGKPLATDIVVIATGHTVVWDDAVAAIPAAGSLASLTGQTTGQITINMADALGDRSLSATTITAGTVGVTGFLAVSGAAPTKTLTINYTTMTGGTSTTHAVVNSGTAAIIFASTGGTGNLTAGGSGFGFLNSSTGAFTIQSNINGAGAAGFRNAGTASGTIVGNVTGGTGQDGHGAQFLGASAAVSITGNVTGGTGRNAMGVYNASDAPIVFVGNMASGTGGVAWGGRPPIWTITGNANYAHWYVGAGPVGAPNTKFGPEPTAAQLLAGVVCGDVIGTLLGVRRGGAMRGA